MKLSVIIPSYKDPMLFKTIQSLLDNSELPADQLEIIAVWDGYYPPANLIIQDPRVKYVHLGQNRGMRGAINVGVSVAKGEFIMRTDEHCSFGKGYDRILTEACVPNCIMTARQFYLDVKKWEVMDLPPVDHQKLVIDGGKKFSGKRWEERDVAMKDSMISETMAMQGSMWIMPKKWWDDVIVELDTEIYGQLIQDSHEMVFKTWKAGGHLMLNKNTWFAHRHRSFGRTHNHGTKENPANEDAGYAQAIRIWNDYYQNEIRPRWRI